MVETQIKVAVRTQDIVQKNEGKLRDFYRIGKVLGNGAFGEVRMCVNRATNAQRAVKVLRKNNMDEDQKRMLFNEINILKELDHPNIVKMFEFFEDDKRYYLVQEICKGGELFDEIIKRGKFDERDAALLVKQILSCVNYCHVNNIVHRDLKPENVLLEANKEFDQIKVIDFGTSLVYDPSKKLDEKLGTPYYIAPEVLAKSYNSKCDVWSIGVITYIILCGSPPFSGQTDNDIMKAVRAGKVNYEGKGFSATAIDFMQALMTYDPNVRPTAQQCLQHKWIAEGAETALDEKVSLNALNNLKTFRADETLKQATYAYIASQMLSKGKKEELAKVFKAFDKNGDGKLSIEEVKQGYLDHYGKIMSDEEVEQMFAAVDADNSGFIDYTEFIVATVNTDEFNSNEFLQAAFKMFDKDGSGSISADEIKSVLGFGSNVDKAAIEAIVKQVDANGDGDISFEEFAKMMKSLKQ